MKPHLDFEKPLVELEERIAALRQARRGHRSRYEAQLKKLEASARKLRKKIYGGLSRWQKTQLSRHPGRPYTLDYIQKIFTEFEELHGDRLFGDDPSIVGGLARFHERPLVVIGHQKGRTPQEEEIRHEGMPMPEGFRKALRLMRLAERFESPIVTFIDTTGAFPGEDAEARGQAEAIARNLREMSALRTPIVSVLIGEGGSGGALALSVSDRILMLEHAIFTVISPEGCAAILWREGERREKAAEALKLTAQDVLELGVIDAIIPEPLGGAHRDFRAAARAVDSALRTHLSEILVVPIDDLLRKRYERFRSIGEFIENPGDRRGEGP
jgi:acetyl-CoA carboxylase carboxyl transferase subunit alpha